MKDEGMDLRERTRGFALNGDCLKELDETDYWLDLLDSAGLVPADKLSPLRNECNQLLAIFTTISKNKIQPVMISLPPPSAFPLQPSATSTLTASGGVCELRKPSPLERRLRGG